MDNSNPQQGTATTTHAKGLFSSSVTFKKGVKYNAMVKDERKIFVGGLRPTLTHDQFRTFFETYGTVIDSVVMTHPDTKYSRGFGFVTFESSTVAQNVLASGNVDGKGCPLPIPKGGWTSGKVWIFDKECEVKVSIPKSGDEERSKNNGRGTKEATYPVSTSESATATASSELSTPSFSGLPTVHVSSDEQVESEGHEHGKSKNPTLVPPPPYYPPQPYPMIGGYQGVAAYPSEQGWVPNLVPPQPYPMVYNPYGGYYAPYYNEYGYAYGNGIYEHQAGPGCYGQSPLSFMEQGLHGYQEHIIGEHGGDTGIDDGECKN